MDYGPIWTLLGELMSSSVHRMCFSKGNISGTMLLMTSFVLGDSISPFLTDNLGSQFDTNNSPSPVYYAHTFINSVTH